MAAKSSRSLAALSVPVATLLVIITALWATLQLGGCSRRQRAAAMGDLALRSADIQLETGDYTSAIVSYHRVLVPTRSFLKPDQSNRLAASFAGPNEALDASIIEILTGYRTPQHPQALQHLAQAYDGVGYPVHANLVLQRLVTDYPTSPEALLALRNLTPEVGIRPTFPSGHRGERSPATSTIMAATRNDSDRLPATEGRGALRVWRPGGRREVWILAVGISAYKSEIVPALPFAKSDADRVRHWFETRHGVTSANIHVLFDEQATRRNILSQIDWLRRSALPEDAVFVYFAGHGAPELAANGSSVDAKYLILYDSDPRNLYVSGFGIDELTRRLDDVKATTQVVILEACYAGPVGKRILEANPTADLEIRPRFMRQLGEDAGRVVLSASSGRQVAIGSEEIAGGLFTHFLLEAWETGNLGLLSEGFESAKDHVRRASNRLGSYQEPAKFGDRNLEVIF